MMLADCNISIGYHNTDDTVQVIATMSAPGIKDMTPEALFTMAAGIITKLIGKGITAVVEEVPHDGKLPN